MILALFLVLLLNVFDAVLTSFVVSNALAIEMNPLMGAVLELGIAPFVIVKISILGVFDAIMKELTKIN